MATVLFANNAASTLAGALTPTSTSAQLAAGTGILFPAPAADQYFVLTFTDAATGLLREIVWVTARTDDTITIQRGKEGTDPLNWAAGDLADMLITAGQMQAMQQSALLFPARIIAASGPFVMTSADGAIGLQRASTPGVSSTTLPADPFVGQQFSIEDLFGNFHDYPVTVNAPADNNIAGNASVILNVNRQCARFRYYGGAGKTWSFDA